MNSPFGEILRQAVLATPGAVGGALAASDGETVDSWSNWEHEEWLLLTAHFGVVINHIRSALHTFHFGDIKLLQFRYRTLDLIIQLVEGDYYVILAIAPPVHLGVAASRLQTAADSLRMEMG